ncbi:MAG: CapA family protein [Clostridiales bacterium]|nr:CapA family protein [Clostridiales bacterium]
MNRKSYRIKNLISLLLVILLLITGCGQIFDRFTQPEEEPPDLSSRVENPTTEEPSIEEQVPDVEEEEPPQSPPEDEKPTGKTSVKVSVVGDIMVHMHQLKAARQADESYDFTGVFEDIRPYLEEADLAIGNLETTISTDEIGYTAYPRFRSPESLISALKGAGIDVLTTANNHSLDGVEFGVENTLDKIDEYGLLHTGTARSSEERDRILMIERNDIRIAILAYTYGTNGMEAAVDQDKLSYMVNYLNDINRIEDDVQRAKDEGAEFIIACTHWGDEYVRNPNQSQKDMADKLFAMGVDVIFGSHPHVIQPTERKTIVTHEGQEKDVFVIYSLGNIVSNQRDPYRDSGLILNVELVKDYDNETTQLGEIDYIPTWVYRYTENDRLHYRILPVKDFMNDDFDSATNARIKEVWNETTTHLNDEHIKARE